MQIDFNSKQVLRKLYNNLNIRHEYSEPNPTNLLFLNTHNAKFDIKKRLTYFLFLTKKKKYICICIMIIIKSAKPKA